MRRTTETDNSLTTTSAMSLFARTGSSPLRRGGLFFEEGGEMQTCTMAGWEGVERTIDSVKSNLEALNFPDDWEPARLGDSVDVEAWNSIEGMTIDDASSELILNDDIWE
jgi:hypothetical protein